MGFDNDGDEAGLLGNPPSNVMVGAPEEETAKLPSELQSFIQQKEMSYEQIIFVDLVEELVSTLSELIFLQRD